MNTPLITAPLLRAQIGKGVVIIDCRYSLADKSLGPNQYREGHLPGAYYFDLEHDLSGPRKDHGGRHPLPDKEIFAQKLRDAGVNRQSLIVVYDDSRMAYAARAWWLIRYLGHEQVAILDGGYRHWCQTGGALDRREPTAKNGNFRIQESRTTYVERDRLLGSSDLTLIDSREPRRYAGLEEPIDPVAGHIPGALNYPWQDITDEQGLIKPLPWQKEHWKDLPKQDELVVYCGSGVTACVNLLSLHLCGIDAKLYPGSWSDWCSYETAGGDSQL